jgi:hypothetical protein
MREEYLATEGTESIEEIHCFQGQFLESRTLITSVNSVASVANPNITD